MCALINSSHTVNSKSASAKKMYQEFENGIANKLVDRVFKEEPKVAKAADVKSDQNAIMTSKEIIESYVGASQTVADVYLPRKPLNLQQGQFSEKALEGYVKRLEELNANIDNKYSDRYIDRYNKGKSKDKQITNDDKRYLKYLEQGSRVVEGSKLQIKSLESLTNFNPNDVNELNKAVNNAASALDNMAAMYNQLTENGKTAFGRLDKRTFGSRVISQMVASVANGKSEPEQLTELWRSNYFDNTSRHLSAKKIKQTSRIGKDRYLSNRDAYMPTDMQVLTDVLTELRDNPLEVQNKKFSGAIGTRFIKAFNSLTDKFIYDNNISDKELLDLRNINDKILKRDSRAALNRAYDLRDNPEIHYIGGGIEQDNIPKNPIKRATRMELLKNPRAKAFNDIVNPVGRYVFNTTGGKTGNGSPYQQFNIIRDKIMQQLVAMTAKQFSVRDALKMQAFYTGDISGEAWSNKHRMNAVGMLQYRAENYDSKTQKVNYPQIVTQPEEEQQSERKVAIQQAKENAKKLEDAQKKADKEKAADKKEEQKTKAIEDKTSKAKEKAADAMVKQAQEEEKAAKEADKETKKKSTSKSKEKDTDKAKESDSAKKAEQSKEISSKEKSKDKVADTSSTKVVDKKSDEGEKSTKNKTVTESKQNTKAIEADTKQIAANTSALEANTSAEDQNQSKKKTRTKGSTESQQTTKDTTKGISKETAAIKEQTDATKKLADAQKQVKNKDRKNTQSTPPPKNEVALPSLPSPKNKPSNYKFTRPNKKLTGVTRYGNISNPNDWVVTSISETKDADGALQSRLINRQLKRDKFITSREQHQIDKESGELSPTATTITNNFAGRRKAIEKEKAAQAKADAAQAKATSKYVQETAQAYEKYAAILEKVVALRSQLDVATAKKDYKQVESIKAQLESVVRSANAAYTNLEQRMYANGKPSQYDIDRFKQYGQKRQQAYGEYSKDWMKNDFTKLYSQGNGEQGYTNRTKQANAAIQAEQLKTLKKSWDDLSVSVSKYLKLKDQSGMVGSALSQSISNQLQAIENQRNALLAQGVSKKYVDQQGVAASNKIKETSMIEGAKVADSYLTKINNTRDALVQLGALTKEDAQLFNQLSASIKGALNNNYGGDISKMGAWIGNIHATGQISDEKMFPLQQKAENISTIKGAQQSLAGYQASLASYKSIQGASGEASVAISDFETRVLSLQKILAKFNAGSTSSSIAAIASEVNALMPTIDSVNGKIEKLVNPKGYAWSGAGKNGQVMQQFAPGNVSNIEQAKNALKSYAASQDYVLQTSLKLNQANNMLVGTYKTTGGRLATITAQFNAQGKSLNILSTQMGVQRGMIGDLAAGFGNFFKMYFTTFTVVPRVINAFKQGFATFSDYNKSLLNISYTMDLTKGQLTELGENALQSAQDLGMAVDQMTAIYQVYSNMEITPEQLAKQAEPTAILANLSGEESTEAADQIQAIMNQYKMLADDDSPENAARQASHVVDVLDKISANIALDYSKGISTMSEATEIAGATASDAGLSFEKLAAIAGKVGETTRQSGSQIGNALKTIMVRTSKANKLSASGEVDNTTLSNASAALHNIGIEVYDKSGEYRNFDTIMTELASKWGSLSDAQQQNISFAIAATRQTNLLNVMLKTYSDATDLATQATEANGNALQNQEKYLESTSGHLQTLSTAASTLWIRFFQSLPIKTITGLLADFMKFLAFATDKAPVLTAILTPLIAGRLWTTGKSFIGSLQGELNMAIGLGGKLTAVFNAAGNAVRNLFATPGFWGKAKGNLQKAGTANPTAPMVVGELFTGKAAKQNAKTASSAIKTAEAVDKSGLGVMQAAQVGATSADATASAAAAAANEAEAGSAEHAAKANRDEAKASSEAAAADTAEATTSGEAAAANEGEAISAGSAATANEAEAGASEVAAGALGEQTVATEGLSAAMLGVLIPIAAVAAALTALAGFNWVMDAPTRSFEDSTEKIEKNKQELEEVLGLIDEYNERQANGEELNRAEKSDLQSKIAEANNLKKELAEYQSVRTDNLLGGYSKAGYESQGFFGKAIDWFGGLKQGKDALDYDINMLKASNESYLNGARNSKTYSEYVDGVSEYVDSLGAMLDMLEEEKATTGELSNENLKYYNTLTQLMGQYDQILNSMEQADQKTSSYQKTVEKLTQSFTGMKDAAQSAKGAAQALSQNLDETNNEGDALKEYKTILKEANKDAKGTVDGTNKFWKAAEGMLGEDRLKELDWDFESVQKEMKELTKTTGVSAEKSYAFYEKLYDKREALAKQGVDVTKVGDAISFEGINTDNISKVADILNVSVDYLDAMIDSAQRFSKIKFGNAEETKKYVKKLAKSEENNGTNIYSAKNSEFKGKNKYVWADSTRNAVVERGSKRDWYKSGGYRDQFVEAAGGEKYLLSFDKNDYTKKGQFNKNLLAYSKQLTADMTAAGQSTGPFGYVGTKKVGNRQYYDVASMNAWMTQGGRTTTQMGNFYNSQLKKGNTIEFEQNGKQYSVDNKNWKESAKELGFTDFSKEGKKAFLEAIATGFQSENVDMTANTVNINAGTVNNGDDDGSSNTSKVEQPKPNKIDNNPFDPSKNPIKKNTEKYYPAGTPKLGTPKYNPPKSSTPSVTTSKHERQSMKKKSTQVVEYKTKGAGKVTKDAGKVSSTVGSIPKKPTVKFVEKGSKPVIKKAGKVKTSIDKVPNKKNTEFKEKGAKGVQKKAGKTERAIRNIPTSHSTSISATVGSAFQTIQSFIDKLKTIPKTKTTQLKTTKPHKARGGYANDDVYNVGERGRELVRTSNDEMYFVGQHGQETAALSKGDFVYTAAQTKSLTKHGDNNIDMESLDRMKSRKNVNSYKYGGEAKTGWALTGEDGRELVQSGSHAYFVGEDHPEMVYLKRGDYVYSNDETEQITKHGDFPSVVASRRNPESGVSGSMGKPSSSGKSGGSKGSGGGKRSGSGKGKGGGKRKGRSKGKSNSNKKKSKSKGSSTTFDWIERKIAAIEHLINKLNVTVNSAHANFNKRAKATKSEIAAVTNEIKKQEKAAKRYKKHANAVTYTKVVKDKNGKPVKVKDKNGKTKTKTKRVKIPKKYRKLVEQGKIGKKDIQKIKNEKLAEAVQTYMDYIDKAREAELAAKQLQQTRLDLAADLLGQIEAKYNGIISVLEARANRAAKANEMLEAKGQFANQKYYNIQIDQANKKLDDQKKELQELINALHDYEKTPGASKYSEEWYALNQKINDCKDGINDTTLSIIELNNQLRQLDWDIFDQAQDYVTNNIDELQFMIDTISHRGLYYNLDSFYDNDYLQGREVDYANMQGRIGEYRNIGRLNERGLAVGALEFTKYEGYAKQAEIYGKEVAKLNKEISKGYDKNLIYRRNELLKLQQQSINSALSEKEAIKSLVSDGYQKMMDALNKLIDKRKEAIEAVKNLYDYQNDLEDQTKNIASLQKQLNSIRNDNSEETAARRQQLSKSLRESRQNLKDTQYDRWINDQSDMLDDLYDRYNQYVDNKIADIDVMFDDLKVQLLNQGTLANDTIHNEMAVVNYNMLEETAAILDFFKTIDANNEESKQAINSAGEFIGNTNYGIGVTVSSAISTASGNQVSAIGSQTDSMNTNSTNQIGAINSQTTAINTNGTNQTNAISAQTDNMNTNSANQIDAINNLGSTLKETQEAANKEYTDALEKKLKETIVPILGKPSQNGDYDSSLQTINTTLENIYQAFGDYHKNLEGEIKTGSDNASEGDPAGVDRPDVPAITASELFGKNPIVSNPPKANSKSNVIEMPILTKKQQKKKISTIYKNHKLTSEKKKKILKKLSKSEKKDSLSKYLFSKNIDGRKSVRKKIAKYLGYSSYNSSDNAKIIKWLKKNGFAQGGTVGNPIKRKTGEDGFVLARTGEEVLSIPKLKLADDMVTKLVNASFDMPKFNYGNVRDVNVGGITFTVENMNLPNVTDSKSFSKEFVTVLQNDNNVQKAIRSVTTDLLSGQNSLRVKRF